MVRKDGTILPVLLSATAITDSAGNYVSSRSTIYDITARKRAENEIRMLAHLQSVVADLGERALRGAPLSQMLDDAANQVAQALRRRLLQGSGVASQSRRASDAIRRGLEAGICRPCDGRPWYGLPGRLTRCNPASR